MRVNCWIPFRCEKRGAKAIAKKSVHTKAAATGKPRVYWDERSSGILDPAGQRLKRSLGISELGNRTRLPVSQCAIPRSDLLRANQKFMASAIADAPAAN